MNDDIRPVCIETDLFVFAAPAGYQVLSLEGEAEMAGPNGELLVVSSYQIDDDSNESVIAEFTNNISNAMVEAANEPDLTVAGKLTKAVSDIGLPVWRLLAEATDQSHFFDQYTILNKTIAVVVTIEGDYPDRTCSAVVEEAVHGLEFK